MQTLWKTQFWIFTLSTLSQGERMNEIIFLILAVFLLPYFETVSITPYQEINHSQSIPEVQSSVTDNLIKLANEVRAENGCETPLVYNHQLTQAAQARAEYVAGGHWTHDGNWETIWRYYKYRHVGENLARFFDNDRDIILAWMNSPTHRDVLLNGQYGESGVGRLGDYDVQ